MGHLPIVFAYLGPETMLPLTSVIAAVAGFLMMFGRRVWQFVVAVVRRLALPVIAPSRATPGSRRIGKGPVGRIKSVRSRRDRVEN